VTFGFSVVGVLMVAIGHPRFCAASSRDALLAWSVVFHFGGGHAMRSKLAKCQCLCLVIEFGMQCHDARSVSHGAEAPSRNFAVIKPYAHRTERID
jgi:hypothetical protein